MMKQFFLIVTIKFVYTVEWSKSWHFTSFNTFNIRMSVRLFWFFMEDDPSQTNRLTFKILFYFLHDAGFGDLAFDIHAYLSGLASVFSQALYLLLVQKHADDIGAAESLHLNSYNTLPMLLICSIVTGEFRSAVANFALTDVGFVVTFVLVIVFGCLLNYLLFLCTTYNSALTTSVTGTLKSIVQTGIGMFTFGGIAINPFTITGMCMRPSI